jgi:predicted nucleic acid-binding protein
MSPPFAFWDSSVLIPICIQQKESAKARDLFARYELAVWWAAPVEIVSGMTRLLRMAEIDDEDFAAGKHVAQTISSNWDLVMPSTQISDHACSLLERYPLRAADALQLAAALEWCEGNPEGQVFLTFDKRLREAAGLAGFTLE